MPVLQSPFTSEFHSDLMTVKETSGYLRIPVPTVYYLVHHDKLPAVQIGGRWRIKRSLLDRDVLGIESRQPESRLPESRLPSVLLVDDDPDSCVLFMQFLRKANLTRSVTSSGAAAIAMAKKQKFDLVFLDLKLPDIPGDEVYVQLKALYPNMTIVIVTCYPDSEILSRILTAGPVTVIKKPLDFDRLDQVVKQLLHKGLEVQAPSAGTARRLPKKRKSIGTSKLHLRPLYGSPVELSPHGAPSATLLR